MRNRHHRVRASVLALLVVLLAACTPTSPQRSVRTYEHISEPTLLYVAMEEVLKANGYAVAKRDMARREIETAWKETDGGRERRRYYAWYELGSLQDRYDIFLELNVQERPPAARDWTDKQVVPEQDAEYVRILQQFDAAVKRIGGVRY